MQLAAVYLVKLSSRVDLCACVCVCDKAMKLRITNHKHNTGSVGNSSGD